MYLGTGGGRVRSPFVNRRSSCGAAARWACRGDGRNSPFKTMRDDARQRIIPHCLSTARRPLHDTDLALLVRVRIFPQLLVRSFGLSRFVVVRSPILTVSKADW